MSFLQGLLGAVLQGTGQGMEEEEKRKLEIQERKAALAEEERRYQRRRKDELVDRKTERAERLATEVQREYVDEATGEMVTVYKNGNETRRKLSSDEIRTRRQEQETYELNAEYKRAGIEAMRRPPGGGRSSEDKPLTRDDALALAKGEPLPAELNNADDEEIERYYRQRAAQIFMSGVTRADLTGIPRRDAAGSGGLLDAFNLGLRTINPGLGSGPVR